MGWSSGTEIMEKIIKVLYKEVPEYEVRKRIYIEIIDAFGDADWDNEDESLGKDEAYDGAYNFYYPERDEE